MAEMAEFQTYWTCQQLMEFSGRQRGCQHPNDLNLFLRTSGQRIELLLELTFEGGHFKLVVATNHIDFAITSANICQTPPSMID